MQGGRFFPSVFSHSEIESGDREGLCEWPFDPVRAGRCGGASGESPGCGWKAFPEETNADTMSAECVRWMVARGAGVCARPGLNGLRRNREL